MISTTLYQIKGFLYQLSIDTVASGDLVYDIADNTYGICDSVTANKISVKDDNNVLSDKVPRSRIFKLIPAKF